MATIEQFKEIINSLDKDSLGSLCEQFVYDHDGAMSETMNLAESHGITIGKQCIKDFITEMHRNGDFDHVECWGLELGANDLYKKFHP